VGSCCPDWSTSGGEDRWSTPLFSLYHWRSPWQILARIIGITPTIYAVRWTKNFYLGMAVHCALNLLGVVLVTNLRPTTGRQRRRRD
jgi:hypothetical protein